MDFMKKIMGNLGVDLFSIMQTFGTGKEIFAFLKDRKAPDVYDSPKIIPKEINGKQIFIIQYTIGYYKKEDAEEFVKSDQQLREVQEGISEVMRKAREKAEKENSKK